MIAVSWRTAHGKDSNARQASNCILIQRGGPESIQDSVAPEAPKASTGDGVCLRDVSAARKNVPTDDTLGRARLSDWVAQQMLLNDRISKRPMPHQLQKSRCYFWIWTGSSTSMIPWAIQSGTSCAVHPGKRLVDCGRAADTVNDKAAMNSSYFRKCSTRRTTAASRVLMAVAGSFGRRARAPSLRASGVTSIRTTA